MTNMQSVQITAIPCRWCGHYNIPNFDKSNGTISEYHNACSNKNCRRTTWNKGDIEIAKIRSISTNNLLIGSKERVKLAKLNNLKKEKIAKKPTACKICDMIFSGISPLNRHNSRRHTTNSLDEKTS